MTRPIATRPAQIAQAAIARWWRDYQLRPRYQRHIFAGRHTPSTDDIMGPPPGVVWYDDLTNHPAITLRFNRQ